MAGQRSAWKGLSTVPGAEPTGTGVCIAHPFQSPFWREFRFVQESGVKVRHPEVLGR